MALYIPTFTTAAAPIPSKAPILNDLIQPKPSLQLHFSKPISRKHFSVPHSATQLQNYVYPDPIPDFAVAETQKFRIELLKKLSKEKETFGDELDDVVSVCAEILEDKSILSRLNRCSKFCLVHTGNWMGFQRSEFVQLSL